MRVFWLVSTALLGLTNAGVAEPQVDSSAPPRIHLVSRNVYMLESEDVKPSYASNVTVLVDADGVLLVDAHGQGDAQPVIAAIRSIPDKPIRYVINTHCHADHTAGDVGLQRAGAAIVAHENVRKRMEEGKCDRQAVSLPTLVFGSELTWHFDDEEVRVIKLPTGHTDGEIQSSIS